MRKYKVLSKKKSRNFTAEEQGNTGFIMEQQLFYMRTLGVTFFVEREEKGEEQLHT